jgi:hypothetical protein
MGGLEACCGLQDQVDGFAERKHFASPQQLGKELPVVLLAGEVSDSLEGLTCSYSCDVGVRYGSRARELGGERLCRPVDISGKDQPKPVVGTR